MDFISKVKSMQLAKNKIIQIHFAFILSHLFKNAPFFLFMCLFIKKILVKYLFYIYQKDRYS